MCDNPRWPREKRPSGTFSRQWAPGVFRNRDFGRAFKDNIKNQLMASITDRYMKLIFQSCHQKANAPHVASIFIDHCFVPYRIPAFLFTENGLRFVNNFFGTLCVFLGENHLMNTAYHLQTIGRPEPYGNPSSYVCDIMFLSNIADDTYLYSR